MFSNFSQDFDLALSLRLITVSITQTLKLAQQNLAGFIISYCQISIRKANFLKFFGPTEICIPFSNTLISQELLAGPYMHKIAVFKSIAKLLLGLLHKQNSQRQKCLRRTLRHCYSSVNKNCFFIIENNNSKSSRL